jgi:hypothetical protein
MDIAQIASLHHQPVQSNNLLLENYRKGQHSTPQNLTRDMSLKLNIPGFRLKFHLPLKFCKRIHSLVPIYGLRTMAMIYHTHWLAQP